MTAEVPRGLKPCSNQTGSIVALKALGHPKARIYPWNGDGAGTRPADRGGRLAPHRSLCGGDAADQIVLLCFAFGADGEGVKDAERQSVFDGFILAIGEIALAKNFHSNHGFAGGFHFAKDADHGLRVGVHVRADGIDAGEIDFDPG